MCGPIRTVVGVDLYGEKLRFEEADANEIGIARAQLYMIERCELLMYVLGVLLKSFVADIRKKRSPSRSPVTYLRRTAIRNRKTGRGFQQSRLGGWASQEVTRPLRTACLQQSRYWAHWSRERDGAWCGRGPLALEAMPR